MIPRDPLIHTNSFNEEQGLSGENFEVNSLRGVEIENVSDGSRQCLPIGDRDKAQSARAIKTRKKLKKNVSRFELGHGWRN